MKEGGVRCLGAGGVRALRAMGTIPGVIEEFKEGRNMVRFTWLGREAK